MGNAQFKDLPILGRALGSSTQVETPLRGRSPPRVMTPGGTLQLPRPRGQPLRAGRNQQKSLPAHAPLNGLCLFLLFGGQVNADTDRSVARRHHTARRLPRAGRGLRTCCGSRAKAFRCLPPPPPRGHTSVADRPQPSPPPFPPPRARGASPATGGWQPDAVCPRSCAGIGNCTRRRPHHCPQLGVHPCRTHRPSRVPGASLRSSAAGAVLRAPRRSHQALSIPVFPPCQGVAGREAPSSPPALPDIPGQSRRASRTGAGRRPPATGKRGARRAPPGAGPRCGPRPWPVSWVPGWGCGGRLHGAGAPPAVPPAPAPGRRCAAGRRPSCAGCSTPTCLACARPRPAEATRLAPPGFLGGPTLPGRHASLLAFGVSLASRLQLPKSGAASASRAAQHACGPLLRGRTFRARPALTFSCARWGSVTAPRLFSHRPRPPGECSTKAFLRHQHPP